MAVTIRVCFVAVDFTKNGEDNAKELENKLNDGWTVVETYQLEFGIIYELRMVKKVENDDDK